jgi:hypothetical protein
LAVKFPGNQFTGEIIPALKELVESGLIRIIDIVFIRKEGDGAMRLVEVSELAEDDFAVYDPLVADIRGLISEDDVYQLAMQLENNSSAGLLLFENVWATRFRDAVVNSKGELIFSERIPAAVVERAVAAQQQAGPQTSSTSGASQQGSTP